MFSVFCQMSGRGYCKLRPSRELLYPVCRTCKKYCKAAEKCEDCEKRFHASCVNLGPVELQKI